MRIKEQKFEITPDYLEIGGFARESKTKGTSLSTSIIDKSTLETLGNLSNMDSRLSNLVNDLEIFKERLKEVDIKNKSMLNTIDSTKENIKALEGKITTIVKNNISNSGNKIISVTSDDKNLVKALENVNAKFNEYELAIQSIKEAYADTNRVFTQRLENTKATLNNEIKTYVTKEILDNVEKNYVSNTDKALLQSEIGEKQAEIQILQQTITSINETIKTLKESLQEIKQGSTDKYDELTQAIQNSKTTLTQETSELSGRIDSELRKLEESAETNLTKVMNEIGTNLKSIVTDENENVIGWKSFNEEDSSSDFSIKADHFKIATSQSNMALFNVSDEEVTINGDIKLNKKHIERDIGIMGISVYKTGSSMFPTVSLNSTYEGVEYSKIIPEFPEGCDVALFVTSLSDINAHGIDEHKIGANTRIIFKGDPIYIIHSCALLFLKPNNIYNLKYSGYNNYTWEKQS